MNPYIGEVKLVPYNFAPLGWAFCDGSLYEISKYSTLFAVLGTTYGGDGIVNFAVPDMRGFIVIGAGQGSDGGSLYNMGEFGGLPSVTLDQSEVPVHSHSVAVSNNVATQSQPGDAYLATADVGVGNVFTNVTKSNILGGGTDSTGAGMPHENRQPLLALNYVIAIEGIFPTTS